MNRAHRIQSTHKDRGSQLVEFALVLMLLLFLLGVVADFGHLFNQWLIITNASREGVRYAQRLPCVSSSTAQRQELRDAIVGAIQAELTNAMGDLDPNDLGVTINPDPLTRCANAGEALSITVSFPVSMMFAQFTGIGDITIRARTIGAEFAPT